MGTLLQVPMLQSGLAIAMKKIILFMFLLFGTGLYFYCFFDVLFDTKFIS
jgi:hypothetical protein